MRFVLVAVALAASVAPALSANYGSAAGCAMYGGGPDTDTQLSDTEPYFFDGATIIGADWACEAATGKCSGEDNEWSWSISVTKTATAATVVIDGKTYTLPRCK